jgi:GxxExxY protein
VLGDDMQRILHTSVNGDPLTGKIIACAVEVHKHLGPGLLESLYEQAMLLEMRTNGLAVENQVPVMAQYKGKSIGNFRIDLLVEDKVIVELKSVERNDPVFSAQILSYMKLTGKKVGLLINFNTTLVTKGIQRFSL